MFVGIVSHLRFYAAWRECAMIARLGKLKELSFFLSSVEKKLRFLMKAFQEFSPYNGLQWESKGSRSKRQFHCKLFKGL